MCSFLSKTKSSLYLMFFHFYLLSFLFSFSRFFFPTKSFFFPIKYFVIYLFDNGYFRVWIFHRVKSVQTPSFSGYVFSFIWTEYRKIRTRKSSVFQAADSVHWNIMPNYTIILKNSAFFSCSSVRLNKSEIMIRANINLISNFFCNELEFLALSSHSEFGT